MTAPETPGRRVNPPTSPAGAPRPPALGTAAWLEAFCLLFAALLLLLNLL